MSVSSLILGRGDSASAGRVPVHCDDDGNLYIVGAVPAPSGASAPKNKEMAAPGKSLVIKNAQGVLMSVTATNTTAADLYLLLFDAAAVPPDTTVPVDWAVIPAKFAGGLDYGSLGRAFTNGIVAAMSTTMETLTMTGANHLLSARYS